MAYGIRVNENVHVMLIDELVSTQARMASGIIYSFRYLALNIYRASLFIFHKCFQM